MARAAGGPPKDGPLRWARRNLFATPLQALLTLGAVYLIWLAVPPALDWAVFSAVTSGSDRHLCDLGRRLTRMSDAAAKAQAGGSQDPAGARYRRNARAYASQVRSILSQRDLRVPPDLHRALEAVGGKETLAALENAPVDGDHAAMADAMATLIPLIAWAERHDGACWTIIKVWFPELVHGRYPDEEIWRANLLLGLFALLALGGLFLRGRLSARAWAIMAIALLIASVLVMRGGIVGLQFVETPLWGSLSLALIILSTSYVIALAVGLLVALGLGSQMPVIRMVCWLYCAVIRGIPTFLWLLVASVATALFLPDGVNFDKLLRVVVAFGLIGSVPIADALLPGLRAVPRQCTDVVRSLGLRGGPTFFLITLPLAVRHARTRLIDAATYLWTEIPLVLIVGLFDILGTAQLVVTNPEWLGFWPEVYCWVAVIFLSIGLVLRRVGRAAPEGSGSDGPVRVLPYRTEGRRQG